MHSLVVHIRSSDLLLLFPALPQSCVLYNKAKQESGLIHATVCQSGHCWLHCGVITASALLRWPCGCHMHKPPRGLCMCTYVHTSFKAWSSSWLNLSISLCWVSKVSSENALFSRTLESSSFSWFTSNCSVYKYSIETISITVLKLPPSQYWNYLHHSIETTSITVLKLSPSQYWNYLHHSTSTVTLT